MIINLYLYKYCGDISMYKIIINSDRFFLTKDINIISIAKKRYKNILIIAIL